MKLLLTIYLAFFALFSFGQSLGYEDFKSLIPYLQKEDWSSAFKTSEKLLKKSNQDSSDFHGVILYIHLFSGAGMVAENKMTFAQLKKKIIKFEGQKIIMSGHPVTSKDGSLSQTKFDISDSTQMAFTSAANAKGTNILCFEKFIFVDPIDSSLFPDRTIVRCGGTLAKIEFNPNESKIWILRLTVTDAFVRKAG